MKAVQPAKTLLDRVRGELKIDAGLAVWNEQACSIQPLAGHIMRQARFQSLPDLLDVHERDVSDPALNAAVMMHNLSVRQEFAGTPRA
jgi:hypothetical protein